MQKVRQRGLGSVPLITSRSRSASSALAARRSLSGHSTPASAPRPRLIVGRLAWKSKNSSGSIRATSSVSNAAPIAPRAVPAAPAASFQPENEATSTGERSSGGSRSQTIGSIRSQSRRPIVAATVGRPVRFVRRGLHDRRIDEAAANPAAAPTPGIAELQPGRPFAGRFAWYARTASTARNGSAYLSLELRDRTGSIPAPRLPRGRPHRARFERGRRDRRSAARSSASAASSSAEVDDAAPARAGRASTRPSSCRPPTARREELDGFLEHLTREVHDPALREVVERGPRSPSRWRREFRRAPCTRGGHHAYLGGLLEHTVAVATLVGEVCQLHPQLDSDLLMAAALLHDVGKAREFSYGAEFGISDEGRCSATSRSARADRARGRPPRAAAAPGAAPLRALPPRARSGRARSRCRLRLRLRRGARAVPAQRPRRVGQGRLGARFAVSGRERVVTHAYRGCRRLRRADRSILGARPPAEALALGLATLRPQPLLAG